MATNKKLDPELADTVERVLEDLMTRFEEAEEHLETRDDLPEVSPETEANLLREIEADLDQYYPQAGQQSVDRVAKINVAVDQMITRLRVSGSEMLDRISELVLPSMPSAAVARSRSAVLNELETTNGVDEATLRELQFVPVRLDREEPNTNILVLRYFDSGPASAMPPVLVVSVDGTPVSYEIDSNLPNYPLEIEIIWNGPKVETFDIAAGSERKIGRMEIHFKT